MIPSTLGFPVLIPTLFFGKENIVVRKIMQDLPREFIHFYVLCGVGTVQKFWWLNNHAVGSWVPPLRESAGLYWMEACGAHLLINLSLPIASLEVISPRKALHSCLPSCGVYRENRKGRHGLSADSAMGIKGKQKGFKVWIKAFNFNVVKLSTFSVRMCMFKAIPSLSQRYKNIFLKTGK